MEALIQGHPLRMRALAVGQGRFQAALLLEPQPDTNRASLVEEVWPLVKQANLLVSGHGQLARTKVEVTNAGKPFQHAGKSTVVRKLTANNAGNADIYNLVNPHPIVWESLLGTLQSHLRHQVNIVSPRNWINSLLKLDVLDSSELARRPALKLLEMFEEIENGKGSLAFDAEHGIRASKTMATLDTVNPTWMNIWPEQWKF